MKGKIYKLHRTLSLVIAIPVLLWASSGLMHPLMTNIRPSVVTQSLLPIIIDSHRIRLPLAEALHSSHIDSFRQCRLVHIDTNWFYQVQLNRASVPLYISTVNGRVLASGDWLYAQHLARQFLEGQRFSPAERRRQQAQITPVSLAADHDCCNEATRCVLGSKGSRVKNAHMLTSFNNEYKSINRLLPVYKVSFAREDGIRVYVETTQDRFAFAMDNRRAMFDEFFRLFHTWGWLDFAGNAKYVAEGAVAVTAFITSLLGIYIFLTTRSKKVTGNKLVRWRRYHRYTAMVAVLFTLCWSGSGAYHALYKLHQQPKKGSCTDDKISRGAIRVEPRQLANIVHGPVTNVSLASIGDHVYWRTSVQLPNAKRVTDLMKEQRAVLSPVVYVNASDGSLLPQGEEKYARHLATEFSGHEAAGLRELRPVTQFTDEYNFSYKRLPVWKAGYSSAHNEAFFVETCSGELAAYVNDLDIPEGYSFSVFHKHHFMDWGGKSIRDLSTMIWAIAQVVMAIVGLILYFRWRGIRSQSQQKNHKTV